MTTERRHFDAAWHEEVVLRDGTRVQLRMVRPEDKGLLSRGFQRLSPDSRYRRFLAPRGSLSERELRYLTEVDGEDHFALGATVVDAAGVAQGAGIARFIRMEDEPDAAEPAIVVTDDLQGRGLGTVLCARLVAAARERGVRRFRCEVLASNDAVLELIHHAAPQAEERPAGAVVVVDMPLPEVSLPHEPHLPAASAVARLLSLAARRLVAVGRALGLLRPPPGAAPATEE